MTTTLPDEPGFAVNIHTGEVHKKYASHAAGLRRTTHTGVWNILEDREPMLCADCYPPPPKASKPSKEPKDEPAPTAEELREDREHRMHEAEDGADDAG